MELRDQIMSDVKVAMKEKDSVKLQTLRQVQSEIKNKEIEVRPNELTENDVLGVLKKAVKQRQESIDQYQAAGRTDLVDKESAELKIIESYLPEQMSSDKVAAIVTQVIEEQSASSMKDMGGVMKEVMVRTGGQADNKIISEIVKSKLQ